MENSLFRLLRIGLGIEQPSDEAINYLASLNREKWIGLRELAERHGVAAIAFDGLNSLSQKYGKISIGIGFSPEQWKMFMLEWMGYLLMIEQDNEVQKDVMNDLAKK